MKLVRDAAAQDAVEELPFGLTLIEVIAIASTQEPSLANVGGSFSFPSFLL